MVLCLVLDATLLYPKLYIGKAPPEGPALAQAGFTSLFLCAQEIQPSSRRFPGLRYVTRAGIDDAELSPGEWEVAQRAGHLAARHVRGGEKVLLTCAQGRNRSGLVAALTLHDLLGLSGPEAVRYVQRRRPWALMNESFVRALGRVRATGVRWF